MCGISGFIAKRSNMLKVSNILAMNNAIAHRGRDDEGFTILPHNENELQQFVGQDTVNNLKAKYANIETIGTNYCSIALGFRRMSIVDLSENGHQPMLNEKCQIAITFNGEIYNYKTLKTELENLGAFFNSESDTEVILKGYEYWGLQFINKLNGMFSIAIVDIKKQQLFLIRDRMGMKPLYFAATSKSLVWCSEIKGILKNESITPSINWLGVAKNFYLQTTPSPDTCFENIKSLPAAHYIAYDFKNDSFSINKYWELPKSEAQTNKKYDDIVKECDDLLQKSIAAQLQADVPVCTMMSGGIDSTTITAIAANYQPNINCFSIGFDDKNIKDEIHQAKLMADSLQIKHHINLLNEHDVVTNIHEQLQHYEDPYNDFEIVNTAANILNKYGYKVVLSGNGADELFGGYPYTLQLNDWYKNKNYLKIFKYLPPLNTTFKKIKNYASLDNVLNFYANGKSGLRKYQENEIGLNEFIDLNSLNDLLLLKNTNQLDIREQLFHYDMHYSLSNHHVVRDDLSAMHHHVEMRYPYLDNDLIDYTATIPLEIRYENNINKPLLRKVAEKYIKKENLNMPKKGFSAPLGYWMQRNDVLKGYVSLQLNNLKKRQIFNPKTIDAWALEVSDNFTYHKIWLLVNFEVWLQTFID